MNKLGRPSALVLVLALLGGCATALSKGAEVYDDALQGALAIKCKAASVGSIERRYMQTQETWELWYKECLGSGARLIPELPESVSDD